MSKESADKAAEEMGLTPQSDRFNLKIELRIFSVNSREAQKALSEKLKNLGDIREEIEVSVIRPNRVRDKFIAKDLEYGDKKAWKKDKLNGITSFELATPEENYELLQFGHPCEYIGKDCEKNPLGRNDMLEYWGSEGERLTKALGLPTEDIAPYINLYTGDIMLLGEGDPGDAPSGASGEDDKWWLHEHWRAIAPESVPELIAKYKDLITQAKNVDSKLNKSDKKEIRLDFFIQDMQGNIRLLEKFLKASPGIEAPKKSTVPEAPPAPHTGQFYKAANKKQLQAINEVFGAENKDGIQHILGDVIDLYPYKSLVRDTHHNKFLTIGASAEKDNFFYVMSIEGKTSGSIYLYPQFSLFPVLEEGEGEQDVEIGKKRKAKAEAEKPAFVPTYTVEDVKNDPRLIERDEHFHSISYPNSFISLWTTLDSVGGAAVIGDTVEMNGRKWVVFGIGKPKKDSVQLLRINENSVLMREKDKKRGEPEDVKVEHISEDDEGTQEEGTQEEEEVKEEIKDVKKEPGLVIDKVITELDKKYLANTRKVFGADKHNVIEWIKNPEVQLIIAFSGGKDSVAMALYCLFVLKIPKERIELWHHEVDGKGDQLFDWACTPSYCEAFAAAFGLKYLSSYAGGGILREMYRQEEFVQPVFYQKEPAGPYFEIPPQGLEAHRNTRLKFPAVGASLTTRWCSAVAKIDVMSKIITNWDRFNNAKVCVMTGERRQESRNRAKYNEVDLEVTLKREVVTWRPIIDWTEKEVWDIMQAHKVQPHPCYELGWGRCSCQLCIFGAPDTWAAIEEISPRKVARIAAIEQDFKAKGEAIIEAEKADPSLIKLRPKKDPKTKKHIKDENGKTIMEPKPFNNVPYLYGDVNKKTGERMDVYQARVDKGKSFIKEENKKRWLKEALGTFTSPIIVEDWKLPAGAFSSRTEGAS